jgi:hypothetical protein
VYFLHLTGLLADHLVLECQRVFMMVLLQMMLEQDVKHKVLHIFVV